MTMSRALPGIAGAAASLAVVTLLARIVGLGRWLVFEGSVGSGWTGTAYAGAMLVAFAPQVVLSGVGVVLTGVLQAHRRFLGPALAPLLSSVVVVMVYLTFAATTDSRGQPIDWLPGASGEALLAWGTTAGVLALSLPLLIPVHRTGLR